MTAPSLPLRNGPRRADTLPIHLLCSGCGYHLPGDGPIRLACPRARAGDDTDHVLRRSIDPAALHLPDYGHPNPFVRYREMFYGYHLARAAGHGDDEIVDTIAAMDRNVAAVEGTGFRITPLARSRPLGRRIGLAAPGQLWVKDETGNVSGSHKARHLFGTLLALELAGDRDRARPLAIASCGNAALAAAVVARAAGRELLVFIPPDAPPVVVARLRELSARVEVCERGADQPGDPTYRRLLRAVADGALPFTCQGNLNAFAIEGGMTLGWELVSSLAADRRSLDHVVIQVGGGALASAVIGAFEEARALGVLHGMPRIHTVQTTSAHPLQRAHRRLVIALGPEPTPDAVEEASRRAARHRSAYMWPWETIPHSVAGGILDDETYDWLAVARGMLLTGGQPVVVDEATLRAANRIAREATGIDVDHTGSSGLAGAMELVRRGVIAPDQSLAVIFTGVRRQPAINGVHS